MRTKKSSVSPLELVIYAALLLGVLVVVFAIFTGGTQKFAKTINDCEQNGGECVSTEECENTLNFECPKDRVCCRISLS